MSLFQDMRQCDKWKRHLKRERAADLEARRRERANRSAPFFLHGGDPLPTLYSIFDRLILLGYGPEVYHFGRSRIQDSRKSIFMKPAPLKDNGQDSLKDRMRGVGADHHMIEWNQIWSEWLETMNNFRSNRLEKIVYEPRRMELASKYLDYVMSSPPERPARPDTDILPRMPEVAHFPPFRDIIRAPEDLYVETETFDSAFAQLPKLIVEWRRKVDTELVELVQIPSHLSSKQTFGGRTPRPRHTTGSNSRSAATDKLRLACAMFRGDHAYCVNYPEVLFVHMHPHLYRRKCQREKEYRGSICGRHGIEYVAEAPYIIHACGLDPNVATVADMDRRDARLKCLSCQNKSVFNWKLAVRLLFCPVASLPG